MSAALLRGLRWCGFRYGSGSKVRDSSRRGSRPAAASLSLAKQASQPKATRARARGSEAHAKARRLQSALVSTALNGWPIQALIAPTAPAGRGFVLARTLSGAASCQSFAALVCAVPSCRWAWSGWLHGRSEVPGASASVGERSGLRKLPSYAIAQVQAQFLHSTSVSLDREAAQQTFN